MTIGAHYNMLHEAAFSHPFEQAALLLAARLHVLVLHLKISFATRVVILAARRC
ncbi:MAG: hypothetical protein Q6370_019790 [Candidatus Sigynarchaeota archaeon]